MKQVSCGDKIVELGSSADRHQAGDTTPPGLGLVTPSECRDMESIDLIVICRGLGGHIEKL